MERLGLRPVPAEECWSVLKKARRLKEQGGSWEDLEDLLMEENWPFGLVDSVLGDEFADAEREENDVRHSTRQVLITKRRDDIHFAELELTGPGSFASQSAIATI